jgi:hypothetical protein
LSQIFERLQQRKDPQVLEEQQQAVNERTQAILPRLVWVNWYDPFYTLFPSE